MGGGGRGAYNMPLGCIILLVTCNPGKPRMWVNMSQRWASSNHYGVDKDDVFKNWNCLGEFNFTNFTLNQTWFA